MVTKAKALWLLLASSLFLPAGCAHEVVHQPATLAAAPSSQLVEVKQEVEIALDSGYARRLARASRWTQAGTLPQGQAYKSVGSVFTVEGATSMKPGWCSAVTNWSDSTCRWRRHS